MAASIFSLKLGCFGFVVGFGFGLVGFFCFCFVGFFFVGFFFVSFLFIERFWILILLSFIPILKMTKFIHFHILNYFFSTGGKQSFKGPLLVVFLVSMISHCALQGFFLWYSPLNWRNENL